MEMKVNDLTVVELGKNHLLALRLNFQSLMSNAFKDAMNDVIEDVLALTTTII